MYHVACAPTPPPSAANAIGRPTGLAVILLSAVFLASCGSFPIQSAPPVPPARSAALSEQTVPADGPATRARPQRPVAANPSHRDRAELQPRPAPTTGSPGRDDRVQPVDSADAPVGIASPTEWARQKAEEDRRDDQVNRAIRSICRGC